MDRSWVGILVDMDTNSWWPNENTGGIKTHELSCETKMVNDKASLFETKDQTTIYVSRVFVQKVHILN